MDYKIGEANEFSRAEINSFKKIVIDAGEVKGGAFDGLIYNNPILLFIPNTSNIEAVGALKIPNDSYKNKVFTNSKSGLESKEIKYELGWIVSLKEGKGLGKMLTEILSKYKPSIYATVRLKNNKMKHILEIFGFEQFGIPYKSDRGNYENILYIKTKKT